VPRPRDVIADEPSVLFVGINPGATSGKVGHHFAGPFNPFWQLLHDAGFTGEPLVAARDHELAQLGYGLVNLCARPTKMARELTKAELARGRARLHTKIRAMKPRVVALVGVTLYPIVFDAAAARQSPGPGAKPEVIEGARVFVVPNPSGLNATFPTYATKLPWFRKLRTFVDETAPRRTRA
jgi:TDG/mug DNA glycosylase family protein